MSISPIFNVTDLFSCISTFEFPVLPSSVFEITSSTLISHAPSTALELPDDILEILDDKFVTLHSGGYRRFLIQWKDCPSTDGT